MNQPREPAGRLFTGRTRVLTQSVRPTVCDIEGEDQEDSEWWNKWHEPFDPREESTKEESTKEESTNKAEEETAGDRADEEQPEEAQEARIIKAPSKPSKEEVDKHMATHIPFRSWCPHCVRGKSKGKPHKRTSQENREIPIVVMDYMFMDDTQNEGEEKGMPILVAKDINQDGTGTGMIFAYVVPQKGVQPYAVKTLAGIVAQLGHQEVILRSDGEPAIVALKEAVKKGTC